MQVDHTITVISFLQLCICRSHTTALKQNGAELEKVLQSVHFNHAGYDDIDISVLQRRDGKQHEHVDSGVLRRRRSVEEEISLRFIAFGDSFHLDLRHVPSILHPDAVIRTTNGDEENDWTPRELDCFMTGNVISHGGTVSLSFCDEVIGSLSTPDHYIYIQHVKNAASHICSNGEVYHVLLIVARKRVTRTVTPTRYSNAPMSIHHRSKRTVQEGDIVVELAVYTDAEFTANMGVKDTRKRVELMLVKYNGVQMEFSRSEQLGFNITFQIKYMHFYEANPVWLNTSTTLLGTWLKDFCIGKSATPYDLNYMHVGTQGLDVTGRAYQDTVCNQAYNCGVDNVADTIQYVATAHEIGHNFGMLHDVDTGCTADAGIMGSYGAGWSSCNVQQLRNFLETKDTSCLWTQNIAATHINPLLQNKTLSNMLIGQEFTPDQICSLKYGEGFQFRKYPLLDVCTLHSCVNHTLGPNYGKMFKENYIPGMYCDTGKICFNNGCQNWATARQDNLEIQEGGWGEWGEWSGCDRTCGRGINFRKRACDSPIPKNHPTCDGNKYEADICNTQPCPDDSDDESTLKTQRATEACTRLIANDVIDGEHYQSTGSVYSSVRDGQCEVKCAAVEGYNVPSFTRYGLMPQGVPCNAEGRHEWDVKGWPRGSGYTSMCIDGYCEAFGCDGKYNGAGYDECGVCGGDNSTCDVISGIDNTTQTAGSRREVMTLPKGAFNIQFWFTYSEMKQNFLEIDTKEGATVLASYKYISWIFLTGNNPVSFADTEWHFAYNHQYLHAKGPLSEPAVIKLYQHKSYDNVGVNYIYSVPKTNSGCTGTCLNGGTFNSNTCSCDCISGYKGNTCTATNCATVFCLQNKTIDESTCQCQCGDNSYKSRCTICNYPFTGINCESCKEDSCVNGGVFNSTTCRCKCPPSYGGLKCDSRCKDIKDDCMTRANNGECVTNNNFMEINCMFSCALCVPEPTTVFTTTESTTPEPTTVSTTTESTTPELTTVSTTTESTTSEPTTISTTTESTTPEPTTVSTTTESTTPEPTTISTTTESTTSEPTTISTTTESTTPEPTTVSTTTESTTSEPSTVSTTTKSKTTEQTLVSSSTIVTSTVSSWWQKDSVSWCHPDNGHRGASTKCTKLPEYTDYQLATCLTSSEVTLRTGNTRCADDCRSYCILPCMTETYNARNGSVTGTCQCDPGLTTDASTGLPTWCFSPQGHCQFFVDCLGARYSNCTELPLTDMTSQCQWFTENLFVYNNCTTRAWIREIRHCLQAFYVDHLDVTLNCSDLSRTYYPKSLNDCFRYSVNGEFDFCSLQSTDRASIISAVVTVFDSNLIISINSTLNWMENC